MNQSESQAIQKALGNWKNRLHSGKLYYIENKQARIVPFMPNEDQLYLNDNLHYFNVIPKARQRGFTTDIDLFLLDQCLHNPNISAGIIAHTLDDAYKIFEKKIKFPYNNYGGPDTVQNQDFFTIGQQFKEEVRIVKSNESTMKFSNGSTIYVSTSFRSGTLQFLHISEFGRIASKYPDKATEIITGAMEAVGEGGVVFIESTAEGKNEFYFIVKEAQELKQQSKKLNHLEPKLFFVPWWKDPNYSLDDEYLTITTETQKYFEKLEHDHKVKCSENQKKWWQMKKKRLKGNMAREYPSFLEEAFEIIIEGAYYKKQIEALYLDNRLCRCRYDPAYKVYMANDLGISDAMDCIFFQMVGKEIRIVDRFRGSNYSVKTLHIIKLSKLGYKLDYVFTPHDGAKRNQNDGVTTTQYFKDLGYKTKQLTRDIAIMNRINLTRDNFHHLVVDSSLECLIGPKKIPMKLLDLLAQYREKIDPISGLGLGVPLHNHESSHTGDAVGYMFRACEWLKNQTNDDDLVSEVYSPEIDDCL